MKERPPKKDTGFCFRVRVCFEYVYYLCIHFLLLWLRSITPLTPLSKTSPPWTLTQHGDFIINQLYYHMKLKAAAHLSTFCDHQPIMHIRDDQLNLHQIYANISSCEWVFVIKTKHSFHEMIKNIRKRKSEKIKCFNKTDIMPAQQRECGWFCVIIIWGKKNQIPYFTV